METNRSPDKARRIPDSGSRLKKVLFWTLGSLAGLSAVLAVFILVSYETFRVLYARAPDPILAYNLDRGLKAALPAPIPVEVTIGEAIPVKLSKVLEAEVPIRKDLKVWIDDDFTIPIDTTFSIPIDQEIYVETEIPVETSIPLAGAGIQADLWGLKSLSLPLSGSIPVKILIPFRGPIQVKTRADIQVRKTLTVHVRKQLSFPLDLRVRVKLPIDDIFEVRFPERLDVNARVPGQIPVNVRLRLGISKQGELIAE